MSLHLPSRGMAIWKRPAATGSVSKSAGASGGEASAGGPSPVSRTLAPCPWSGLPPQGKTPAVGPLPLPVRAWGQRACLGLPAPHCWGPSWPAASRAGFWEAAVVAVWWGGGAQLCFLTSRACWALQTPTVWANGSSSAASFLRPASSQTATMSVMTLWTAARQALLSMAASKQGYWGGLPNDAHTRGFSSVFGVFWFQEAVIQKKGAGERREPRAEAGKRSGSPGSCLSRPGWRHPGPLTLSLRGPIRRARVTLSSPPPHPPHTNTA